jgi:hypothetical protein
MAKITASITTNSPYIRTDHPSYLVDSSSKYIIGRPVDSFSNIVGTDRIIKEACNVGGAIAPSIQRLLSELPTDDDKLAVANFIIESYHDRNISVETKFFNFSFQHIF